MKVSLESTELDSIGKLIQSGSGSDILAYIQAFDASLLERESDLGRANKFTEIAGAAHKTIGLFRLVDARVAQLINRDHANALYSDAKEVLIHIKAVFDYAPDASNAAPLRDELKGKASELLARAHAHLPPFMAESARLEQRDASTFYENIVTEQKQQLAATERLLNDAQIKVNEIGDRVDQALTAAREAAVQSGVHFQADQFQQAANSHQSAALWWLITMYVFASLLAVWAVLGPWALSRLAAWSGDTISTEQLIAAKILSFAVISFMVVVAARSFFAHRHNTVVNQHRQNALVTYKAIVEASGHPGTREIVLQYAASCIFGPQATGYSREGKAGPPTVQNVIETLGNRVAGSDHA